MSLVCSRSLASSKLLQTSLYAKCLKHGVAIDWRCLCMLMVVGCSWMLLPLVPELHWYLSFMFEISANSHWNCCHSWILCSIL
jgi:hypothetical protein